MTKKAKKETLIFDGSLFANTFSRKNSDRTGVFFVAYNLFLKIARSGRYELSVYCEESRAADVRKALQEWGLDNIPLVHCAALRKASGSFFSPCNIIPMVAEKNDKLARYLFLYDVTPLAIPALEQPNIENFKALGRSLNNWDYYFADSNHARKDFLRYFPVIDPDKIQTVYLAASENFYCCRDESKIESVREKYGIPKDKPYVFSLCTLQPRKNLIHAVRCFAKFIRRKGINDLYFVLGGGHWEVFIRLLEQELGELQCSNRIIKTGYIDDEDLAPLYSGAMFTVYVSLYEGFGLPILEAMQCGCPVIASNRTSMPEVLGDAGILVDPQDPVALVAAYEKMYTDTSFREACRQASIARAAAFSWDKCANEVMDRIDATHEKAVSKQTGLHAGRKIEVPAAKSRCRRVFGKEHCENVVTLRFFGLPVLQKKSSADLIRYTLLGIPVGKKKFDHYVIRTYVLGIRTSKRINLEYINGQFATYTDSLAQVLSEQNKQVRLARDKNAAAAEERLHALPFYRLTKDVYAGRIGMREEMEAVNAMLEAEERK